MYSFDFSSKEYNFYIQNCPFTDEELSIIELRRKGKSNTYVCMKLNISDRTLSRRIKSIAKKIAKESL